MNKWVISLKITLVNVGLSNYCSKVFFGPRLGRHILLKYAKIRNIAELEDNGISMQQELWKKYLDKQIYKLGKIMDAQQFIPFESTEALFNLAQDKFGKNFFFKTMLSCMPNLEELIQQIGHKRKIEDILFDLVGREGRRKLILQLDEILAFSREMKLSRVKSLDLYQELHRKAVA